MPLNRVISIVPILITLLLDSSTTHEPPSTSTCLAV